MWARRAAIRCSCCWHVGRAVPGLSDARQTHEHKRARQRARPLGPWLRSRRQLEGRGQGRQPWWWKLLRARRAGIRCVCCWRVGRAVRGLSDAGQTHEHKRARHRACSSGLWFRLPCQQPQWTADCLKPRCMLLALGEGGSDVSPTIMNTRLVSTIYLID